MTNSVKLAVRQLLTMYILTEHFRDNLPHMTSTEFEDEYRLTKIQTNLSAKTGRNRSQSVGGQSLRRRRSSKLTLHGLADLNDEHDVNNHLYNQGYDASNFKSREPSLLSNEDGHSSDIEAPALYSRLHVPFTVRVRYWLWRISQVLSSYDCKFTIKMAGAVLILSLPAYIPSSQEWYANVRGQWSAVTVSVARECRLTSVELDEGLEISILLTLSGFWPCR